MMNTRIRWRLLLVALALAVNVQAQSGPALAPIKVEGGLISGLALGEKKDVCAYKGIPYVAPPVGALRWRPPQPVKPWDGVRACAEYGSSCPQPKPLMGGAPVKADEDCLYLNVWAPARASRLPVMVWIHGGGYTTGSGSQKYYDGEAFARQGVVLVTINYRLGPFGFFAHPALSQESSPRTNTLVRGEKGVSGNYGLLDQIAALQWVQKNIAAFGGDPGCVTIFGESAGAGSVCHLIVSPLAKGLFHRAIAESGTAYGVHRRLHETRPGVESAEKMGEQLAKDLGCESLAALRAKTPDEILAAAKPSQGIFGKGTKFWPIVDGWVVPDDPPRLYREGKVAPVPLMIGTNADEATVFLKQLDVKDRAGYEKLMQFFFKGHAPEVLALYPATADGDVRDALDRAVTDSAFVAPARFVARDMSRAGRKVFLYHFTRVRPFARMAKLGAFHAAEIPYVFNNMQGVMGIWDKDRELARTMNACWARFAAKGDPNGEPRTESVRGEGLPQWPQYEPKTDPYLEFGEQIRAGAALHKQACDLFDKIQAARLAGHD